MESSARLAQLAAAARRLRDTVLDSTAVTTPELRRAVFDGDLDEVAAQSVAAYVVKVRDHADRITDADIAALRQEGLGDDAIFELTAAAALGAAERRLVAGLALLGQGAGS
jgi:alkylhydroperoxidase family enzyme